MKSIHGSNKTYVGVTNCLKRRIRQHNGELKGGARYTKRFKPWSFAAVFQFRSRTDALKVEWRVKHLRSKKDGKGLDGTIARVYRHGSEKLGFCRVSTSCLS